MHAWLVVTVGRRWKATALASLALVSQACSGKAVRTLDAEPSSAGAGGSSSVGGAPAMGSGGSGIATGGSVGKGGAGPTSIHPPVFDGVPPDFAGIDTCAPGTTTATLTWTSAHDAFTPDDRIVYLIYVTKVGDTWGEPRVTAAGARVGRPPRPRRTV